ncbi:myogenesis-regulating glycosidase isoform X1 [Schistocerca nitens]|uniref:myogenesis-regulating glycosidase isoform X1 n=1 Tax=Schistocerca nitens TaxID=7011 RepID=UPI00211814C8|nr:myogenesis-regulating glycosidase isoform X1 [Schistocerca nitens]
MAAALMMEAQDGIPWADADADDVGEGEQFPALAVALPPTPTPPTASTASLAASSLGSAPAPSPPPSAEQPPPQQQPEQQLDESLRPSASYETVVTLHVPPRPARATGAVPKRRSRRTSVSLPAGLDVMDSPDLQLTPTTSHDGDLSDSSFTDGDLTPGNGGTATGTGTEDSDTDTDSAKSPVRRVRRKSAKPPSDVRVDDIDYLDVPELSPGNSITSNTSIASLLKEKIALSFPAYLKKRKPPREYKLKAFVSFLFLCIVFLVGFAYVMYDKHVLQRAYFERMRYNKEQRQVRIFDESERELVVGRLGLELGLGPAYECLERDRRDAAAVCMEWPRRARLHWRYSEPQPEPAAVRCYRLSWQALSTQPVPRDCYQLGDANWYGAGHVAGKLWPLPQGLSLNCSPFVTGGGPHPWGNVLSRYFLSSAGVSISVDAGTPLYVSLNASGDGALCLEGQHDKFAYHRAGAGSEAPPPAQLNYTVCTAANMRDLHSFLADKNMWDGMRDQDRELVDALISEPVWQIAPPTADLLTEAAVYNYTEEVIALPFLRQGHVMLNSLWQAHAGDLELDAERFATWEETFDILQRRGFGLVLGVQPFVSTESAHFAEAVRARLLVAQRDTPYYVPALVARGPGLLSAGVLDVTNNHTVAWLQQRLRGVQERYHVTAFYLEVGTATDQPQFYQYSRPLYSPDEYKTVFTESVLRAGCPVVGVTGAVRRPRAPVFVSLPLAAGTWAALQSVIPAMLAYGVAGYPLVMPGAAGGDLQAEGADGGEPDRELYARWLQLVHFLPVVRYRLLPSAYDEQLVDVAKELTALRAKTVTPVLKKFTEMALVSGLPVIRPLWMLDPADHTCHRVLDQFSVGDEILVAPVLEPGAVHREVYLPAGVWRDGIDGSLRKGSRWLHHYHVSPDHIAYFMKMPDNTRF